MAGGGEPELSPATANRHLAALKGMFRWAEEMGKISASPARRVRLERETTRTHYYLSEGEKILLIEAAGRSRCPFIKPAILLALHTGMRKDEIFGLSWDRAVRNEVAKAIPKFKRCRFHDLRHTYASDLVVAGSALEAVGRILGHTESSAPTTSRRYVHLRPEHHREAAEVIRPVALPSNDLDSVAPPLHDSASGDSAARNRRAQ